MANRVLTETYPTVAPRGAPENDYERIPTSPAMFGGLIAQGEEKAGQGLEAASSAAASVQGFYSQVTASDAYNKLDDAYHKMQFGDPNDPNNPGFYALKGQNALSARGGVEQQMEDTRQQLKTGLNPYARLMFEQDSRRLQAMTLSNIGRHADQQFDEYATSTATATQANAVRRAGTFADDDSAYVDAAQSGAKAIGALAKARGSSPDELEKMTNDFQTAMVQSRVEGLITTDPVTGPVRAKTFLDAHKDQINPAIYNQLTAKLVEPFAQGANAQAADAVAKGWKPPGGQQKQALLAVGTNDWEDRGAAEQGVSSSIAAAKAKGYDPVVVLPNKIVNGSTAAYDGAVAAAKAAGVKTEYPAGWGLGSDAIHMSPAAADIIKKKYPDAVPIGDSNAVRLGAKEGESGFTGQGGAAIAARIGAAGGGRAPVTPDRMANALYGQESGFGANTRTSITGATGGMQIEPATFRQYAQPGEDINNRADNIAVGNRIVTDYMKRYNGDPERVATAYFSGPANVAPAGSPTPWIRDAADPTGKRTSSYVADIMKRLGQTPSVAPGNFAPAGHDIFGPAGPQPPAMGMSDFQSQPTVPTVAGETPQPAAFTIEPPTTPGTPIGAARTPDDDLATRVQYIEAQNWSPEIKNAAIGMAERDYKLAAIAAGQSDKEKKDRKEAAINDVEGYVLKGDYAGAFKKLNSYGDDQITNQEKLALQDVIERRSGEPSPTSYGPKYSEMFKHVIAPDGDPQRIGDITALYQAEANGDLTAKGTERLKTVMTDVRKNTDEYGLQREVAGVYDFAKQRLDFSIDEPFLKVPDPKGRSVFDLEFTTMFNSQLDAWRKTGKDVSQFPLFQRDKLNQMLDILRPKAQMDRERMAAVGETAQAPEPAGAPLPPAPSGVDQTKWSPLVSAPPGGLNHAQWGMALNDLVTKQDVGVFNASKFGQSGLRGEDILNRLGIAYAPPGKPEGVGAETPSALQAPVPPTPEQARAQRAEEEKRKAPLPSAQTPEAASVTSKIGDFLKSLPHIGEPHLTEKK